MKNLTNALTKGNLTPKERVILLVHNAVKEDMTGKGVLTDAEKHALSEGWKPLNNEQVREYNRFNKAWRTAGFAELDAQTTYLGTEVTFYRERQATMHLLFYPLFRDAKKWVERLDDIVPVDLPRALEIIEKQKKEKLKQGQDFEYTVYLLAFESLEKEVQDDLTALYEEVHYDTEYLDQEEALAEITKGKETLTAEDKEKIASNIVKRAYNSYAKEWQLWHFYGGIPLKEIAKRWIAKRGIQPTPPKDVATKRAIDEVAKEENKTLDELMKDYTAEDLRNTLVDYAKAHDTTPEAELKAVVLDWLDNGLLESYTPLYKSTSHNTYTTDTKLPHNEVYRRWIEAKTKARATLEGLIREGKLQREGDTITGESLYNFTGDYKFIQDFKKRVDKYDANLGIVYADDDPEHKGQHLDRELLICDVNDEGKPYGLSLFSMSKRNLKQYFDLMGFVEEKEVDGERIIQFKEMGEKGNVYEDLLKNSTEALKENYAILLAFREIFNRLSKTYRIDVAYKINKWIKEVEDFIDNHNSTLDIATSQAYFTSTPAKKVAKFKQDLHIDKAKIQALPSHERVAGYFKEFEETLGSDF